MNLQFLVDGLLTGSIVGLGAIGVTLTYSILRFSNFAHGEFLAWGAYAALVAAGVLGWLAGGDVAAIAPFSFGWTLILASVIAMVFTGLLALTLDWLLFRHLRRRANAITAVMASFGAAMALRSLLEFIFTSSPAYFSRKLQIAQKLGLGIRATPDQMVLIAATAVLVTAIHLVVTRTQVGRSMRAVSENPDLARVAGIDVGRIVAITWMIGGGLACFAGIMVGLLVQIRPYMGLDLLLPLFAAAILGGIGSIPGALIGGLIVGLAEALAVQTVGAEWRSAVAFVLLIAMLLVRPSGLMGGKS